MTLRPTAMVFGAALVLCALFFAEGCLFIPQVGMQEDEVQFVGGIFPPLFGRWFAGEDQLPLMIATYAGGLKALAYIGIFEFWVADVWSLRMPVLLLGVATVFLFFLFFRMTLGDRAALIATAILACDPVFVICTALDFGIVAVQHFLMAAALPLFVLYHRTGRRALLGLACFLCGLALWDKATFIWILLGLGAGLLAVFPRELRPHLKPRRILLAGFSMALGASPVIYYTVTAPRDTTASGMGGFAAPGIQKVRMLVRTLDGSSLFGFITRGTAEFDSPGRRRVERAAVRLSRAAGNPLKHALLYASLASLALLPWLWRQPVYRRAMLFSAVAFVVGWLAMLPFAMGAGGSHHIILLWPLPQMLVAAALCAAASRIPRFGNTVALVAAGAIALSCLLVTNQYYAMIVRFGPPDYWTDAINPLYTLVSGARAKAIHPLDWGIGGPLRTMGEGTLPLKFTQEMAPDAVALQLRRPGGLFIFYKDRAWHPNQEFQRVRDAAGRNGLKEELVAEVADRHGRPVYRVVRYVGAHETGS